MYEKKNADFKICSVKHDTAYDAIKYVLLMKMYSDKSLELCAQGGGNIPRGLTDEQLK